MMTEEQKEIQYRMLFKIALGTLTGSILGVFQMLFPIEKVGLDIK